MAIIFKDVNLKSGQIGDTDVSINVQAIRSSIFTILGTNLGERLFHLDFGSNIETLLFEPMDDTTAFHLRNMVFESLKQWEPRVVLDTKHSTVEADYDNQCYIVNLIYTIPALEHNDFLSFSLNKSA